jgi:hypothetical protein
MLERGEGGDAGCAGASHGSEGPDADCPRSTAVRTPRMGLCPAPGRATLRGRYPPRPWQANGSRLPSWRTCSGRSGGFPLGPGTWPASDRSATSGRCRSGAGSLHCLAGSPRDGRWSHASSLDEVFEITLRDAYMSPDVVEADPTGMDMLTPVTPWPPGEATSEARCAPATRRDGEVQRRRAAMSARHRDRRILVSTVATWRAAMLAPT